MRLLIFVEEGWEDKDRKDYAGMGLWSPEIAF
jgi:hypothetical protein